MTREAPGLGKILIPILEWRQLRLRQMKWFVQTHTVWQDAETGLAKLRAPPTPTFLYSRTCCFLKINLGSLGRQDRDWWGRQGWKMGARVFAIFLRSFQWRHLTLVKYQNSKSLGCVVFAEGNGPPCVFPGPEASTSPGNLLDMQILGKGPSHFYWLMPPPAQRYVQLELVNVILFGKKSLWMPWK